MKYFDFNPNLFPCERDAMWSLWPACFHTHSPCVSTGCDWDWVLNTTTWLLRHQQNATRLQLFQASTYKYTRSLSGTHFSPLNLLFNQHHSLSLRSIKNTVLGEVKTNPALCQWGRRKGCLYSFLSSFVRSWQTFWHRELSSPSSAESLLILTDRV